VFPDKDNGLIVDYIGVSRNLEKASKRHVPAPRLARGARWGRHVHHEAR
jgi:hypothetical protein